MKKTKRNRPLTGRLKLKAEAIAKKKHALHQKTLFDLESRLKDKDFYKHVATETEYNVDAGGGHYIKGEVDVYAIYEGLKGNYLLLFEVKATHTAKNYHHARDQLDKAELLFADSAYRILKFYVTPKKIKYYRR